LVILISSWIRSDDEFVVWREFLSAFSQHVFDISESKQIDSFLHALSEVVDLIDEEDEQYGEIVSRFLGKQKHFEHDVSRSTVPLAYKWFDRKMMVFLAREIKKQTGDEIVFGKEDPLLRMYKIDAPNFKDMDISFPIGLKKANLWNANMNAVTSIISTVTGSSVTRERIYSTAGTLLEAKDQIVSWFGVVKKFIEKIEDVD